MSHAGLKVVISESPQVSQPNAFGRATPPSRRSRACRWTSPRPGCSSGRQGASLQAIIDVVNSTGATPDDIMAILQALDRAGAIDGELEVL